MKNLIQRTIFGSIYVAVIVLSCLVWRPSLLGIVFLIVSMLATKEYARIMQVERWISVSSILLSGLLLFAAWMAAEIIVLAENGGNNAPVIPCLAFYLYLLLLFIFVLVEFVRKLINPVLNSGYFILLSQLWIAIPFALMVLIGGYEPMLLLSLFVIIWVNDSGAYCVGSLIGKHKMIPSVSPGKSWEGLFGGIAFAMGAGYIFLADPFGFTGLQYAGWQWIVLTLIITIFGTLGDLLESKVKRTLGIKDSGNAIPGHGGWLDRFDSVLIATLALVLYLVLSKAFIWFY